MSSYTPSNASLRYRSGSVERSSRVTSSSRDTAPYRTSYGTERGRSRDVVVASSGVVSGRMSRATSYDPFASSSRASSVIRSTNDYTPRMSSYSSRYGSTEQLTSTTSSSSSTSSSSYRPSSSSFRAGATSSGGGGTSSYTPRNVRAGSVSIGAYDPPRSAHSDTLSRYRPPETTSSSYTPSLSRYRSTDLSTTSDYSSSKYRSPDNSYSSSTRASSIATSVGRFTPKTSPYSSRTSTSSSYRSDRDYRSMSRTTDNEAEEEDEVESTFRKLYKKYVTAESEPDLTKSAKKEESLAEKVSRRFASKSDAEEEEGDDSSISEEDDEMLARYQSKSLRRASSASSLTPRASVCNSPSKEVTPKCSPLPTRKSMAEASEEDSEDDVEPREDVQMKPLTRSFQMEATFGTPSAATAKKNDDSEDPTGLEGVIAIRKGSIGSNRKEDVMSPDVVKKVAASIKINGIPVKEKEDVAACVAEAKEAVRIRIRTENSTIQPIQPEETLILTAANVVLEYESASKSEDTSPREKSSESDTTTCSSRGSSLLRKRRDPNRTMENLQSILRAEKEKEETEDVTGHVTGHQKMRRIPIPLVLITEPSNPSTPLATTPVTTAASICLWNNKRMSSSSSDNDNDEEENDEEVEDEYSSGDWTEGEDDDEEYVTDEEEYSVSQTFSLKDHMSLKELYPLATSPSNASALVSEFSSDGDTFLTDTRKEESRGRVDSLFAVPAPTFTCSVTYDGQIPGDDEEEEWSDEVHSCEEGDDDDDDFRVLPIGRAGSSSLGAYMSPSGMTSSEEEGEDYDGRTVGCTLKLVDRAARKDSGEESEESEYYDDEEYEDEEYWDEEIEYEDEEYEYDDEEEEEEEEEVLEEFLDEEEEEEDVTMKSVTSSEPQSEDELFVAPPEPIKLMTESLVEEMIEEACYGELPEETLFALDGVEVEDYTGTKDVQMIPTFVRQTQEDVREESTSRFAADRKPATDFARKAVIQPTKLEKVHVGTRIDTKVAPSEEEKRKKREAEAEAERKRKEDEAKKEDKSALRKSALNMKDDDAKRKVATDEKAAAQKARRFGTVSAMAGKFVEKEQEPEHVYKKSTRLVAKDSEKPKRTYEVIKPVINDDFDKQMEEIRKQMKSGSTELQSKMKSLSKGILTATEEAKTRELEEKRRVISEKATGAFGKAEEEKARWKASRDAEAAREYAKIEAEKHLKKKRILIDNPAGETVLNQEKAVEPPKRTIRRWKPPPPDPNAVIPSFSCGPKEPTKPKSAPAPSPDVALPGAASPTVRRKMVASPTVTPAVPPANIPKSEGAAATRIRNNNNNNNVVVAATSPTPAGGGAPVATPHESPRPVSKRYSARRKTQEIVNESAVKPKTKRRKRTARKRRFIRDDHRDADVMLGFQSNSTFEQLEKLFEQAARNRRIVPKFDKIRRMAPSKIFISELTDIDKIYKSSEIRDIIASVNLVY